VRMFGEQGRYVRAVNCAARLVNVNPQSQYAPQLLLAGAEYAQKNSQPQRAAELLEKLLKNYPESPLCDNAKKLLNQWHNSQ
ncbi:MAG TPA: tetratricopeptide repeat protein, partial [Phycisphaerae bacterium]|nr:tetratricopeptide repeat protein [Phycisphaerae bacterium]